MAAKRKQPDSDRSGEETVTVRCCITGIEKAFPLKVDRSGPNISRTGWKFYAENYYSKEGWEDAFVPRAQRVPIRYALRVDDPWTPEALEEGWKHFGIRLREAFELTTAYWNECWDACRRLDNVRFTFDLADIKPPQAEGEEQKPKPKATKKKAKPSSKKKAAKPSTAPVEGEEPKPEEKPMPPAFLQCRAGERWLAPVLPRPTQRLKPKLADAPFKESHLTNLLKNHYLHLHSDVRCGIAREVFKKYKANRYKIRLGKQLQDHHTYPSPYPVKESSSRIYLVPDLRRRKGEEGKTFETDDPMAHPAVVIEIPFGTGVEGKAERFLLFLANHRNYDRQLRPLIMAAEQVYDPATGDLRPLTPEEKKRFGQVPRRTHLGPWRKARQEWEGVERILDPIPRGGLKVELDRKGRPIVSASVYLPKKAHRERTNTVWIRTDPESLLVLENPERDNPQAGLTVREGRGFRLNEDELGKLLQHMLDGCKQPGPVGEDYRAAWEEAWRLLGPGKAAAQHKVLLRRESEDGKFERRAQYAPPRALEKRTPEEVVQDRRGRRGRRRKRDVLRKKRCRQMSLQVAKTLNQVTRFLVSHCLRQRACRVLWDVRRKEYLGEHFRWFMLTELMRSKLGEHLIEMIEVEPNFQVQTIPDDDEGRVLSA